MELTVTAPTTPIVEVLQWGMRGWSVLGSVLLMGFGALVWSPFMARWIDSKLIH